MALNELLIISIQTRLKGSLLIGHRKQEPLLVLHNCPLLEVHSAGAWGVTLSGMGWPSRGPCPPPGSVSPPGVCAHAGLCVLIWGYAC